MEHICAISGITMRKVRHFPGLTVWDIHPLFKVGQDKLLSKWASDRFANSLNIEEQKLIFLATLKLTGLVSFKATIKEDLKPQQVINLYPKLFSLTDWIINRSDPETLPRLVISPLEGIGGLPAWLDALAQIRADGTTSAIAQAKHDAAAKQHQDLIPLLRAEEAKMLTETQLRHLSKKLALWACEAAGASKTKLVVLTKTTVKGEAIKHRIPQFHFLYQFLITPENLWHTRPKAQIEKVQSWFETNLPYAGWPACHAILEKLSKMKASKMTSSELFELLTNDVPYQCVGASEVVTAVVVMQQDKQQQQQRQQLVTATKDLENDAELKQENSAKIKVLAQIQSKELPEPQAKDFNSPMQFAIARAKWTLACKQSQTHSGGN